MEFKKFTFFALILCSAVVSEAQFQQATTRPLTGDIPAAPVNLRRSATIPKVCGVDTVMYPYQKASQFMSIAIKKGSALGQFYPAPGDVTVYGFEFYAWALATTPPSARKVNLICNMYKAGTDSLPSGSPLRSDTITVDTTFGAGLLTTLRKRAFFDKPITVNYPYILTIECDSTNNSAGLVSNSWTARNGKRENLGCGSVSGKWYRALNLNIGGAQMDADMILMPFAGYNFGTDFKMNYNPCFPVSDTVRFTNQNKNSIVGNKIYNRYVYYNLEQYCHRWNHGENPWTYIYEVNSKKKYAAKGNYDVTLISTIYQWRSGQCIDTTVKSLFFRPDVPGLKGSSQLCGGDSTTFTASSESGTTVEWFRYKTDTVPFLTGYTYNTGPRFKNDTFLLRTRNGECLSGMRSYTLPVYAYPNKPTVKNDSVCSGSSANLSASSNIGQLKWFTQSSGGSSFYNGSVFQTDPLNSDTSYWVEAENNGCVTSPRVEVKALVGSDFAPTAPTTSPDTSVCLRPGGSITLRASAQAGKTVRWYNVPSGGNPIATGNTLNITPTSRGHITRYVDAWNGTCPSTRKMIDITVNDYPNIISLVHDTVCLGDTLHLEANASHGTTSWYDASSGGNLVHSGNVLNPGALTQSATWYIETSEGSCVSPARTPVRAVVNKAAAITNITAPSVCAKSLSTLSASIGYGKLNWYEDTTALPIKTGSSLITPPLLGNQNYWIQSSYAGCTGPFIPVTVSVKPRPVGGFTYDLRWLRKVTFTPVNMNGSTFFWNFDDGQTSTAIVAVHQYAAEGAYNVMQVATSSSNGCTDTTIVTINVNHTGISKTNAEANLNVFPVPAGETLEIEFNSLISGNGQMEIYSTDGRLLKSVPAEYRTGKNHVSVRHGLAAGVYLLSLKAGDLVYTRKISVQP